MGTSKSGRYLNTKGSGRSVSDYSLFHSDEGTFRWEDGHKNGMPIKIIRLDGGGHGQNGMNLLKKYHLAYKVVKTWPNGVRVGNVLTHKDRSKRILNGQTWFPANWTSKDIKHAGEYVASLKRNRNTPNGKILFGNWKGVRVGVIKTNGKIATIFPDKNQISVLKKGRKKKWAR